MMRPGISGLASIFITAVIVGACSGGASPAAPSGSTAVPASLAASPSSGDIVGDIDIGGRTLSIACLGPTDTGRPTVVFESGLGGDRFVWGDVLTRLMATDRGCTYDRAGLGASPPAATPRTTDEQVDDLHALLGAAGIEPPYILVGHSSGGWNVMVYADRYPADVAGAVMVDVRPPSASERWLAALPPETETEPEPVHQYRAELTDFEGDASLNPERLDLIKSAGQADAASGFGDAPLIVLTAGERAAITEGLPADLAASFDDIWMELQTDLVALSTAGRQEIVPNATHDMPFEQPGVIVDAIRAVLNDAAA